MRAPAGVGHGDAGESLLESVISFAILATAVIGILGTFGALASLTDRHRDGATADTVMYQYSEALKAGAYIPGAAAPVALGFTPTTGFLASVHSKRCWAGGSADTTSMSDFPLCTATNDGGLQLLELRVTAPDGSITSTSLLKRQPV